MILDDLNLLDDIMGNLVAPQTPLVEEPTELVVSREVTPLIDQARALLPLGEIATVEAAMKTYVIQDEAGEATVNEYMRRASGWTDTVTKFWKPKKEFWHKIHAACCAAEKETAPAVGQIRAACESAIKVWMKKKTEAYYAAQRKIEQQTAEAKRQQDIEARKAAMAGDLASAERIKAASDAMRSPTIIQQPTKLEGTAVKEVMVATCHDPMALLKAVASGEIPLMHKITVRGKGEMEVPLFTVNDSVLAFYAGKLGQQFRWPGVSVEPDVQFAARKLK